jgi:carbon-monoxide dehydrogenase large subunit
LTTTGPYTGRSLTRTEDDRFLRGAGQFVADLALPGMLHLVVVRSTEAHARILGVDAVDAQATPGVVAVVTAEDLAGSINKLEVMVRPGANVTLGGEHPLLAVDRVLYVGQPVAVVIAESLAVAEDAAALVDVAYEPLPALVDPTTAMSNEPLHPGVDANVVLRTTVAAGDVPAAFATAHRRVSGTFNIPRVSPAPMEGRGCVAVFDDAEQRLQVWTSTQSAHEVRSQLLHVLGESAPDIHAVSLDVGGGFGQKHHLYPDEAMVVVMAHRLGRPVRWIESRQENMIASHSRGFDGRVDAAVSSDGRILAIDAELHADLGALQLHGSFLSPDIAAKRLTGPYDIQNVAMSMLGVLTNKPPMGPYRGAGQPEVSIMMERLVDLIAVELDLDPVDVRSRNLIQPDQFPYTTAGGVSIDSGNYEPALRRVLEVAEYDAWRQEQARARADGRLLGIGVATTASGSGGSGGVAARSSFARITVDGQGHVTIDTDVSPHGQGMETSFAQLVADQLGVAPEAITLRSGDTDKSTPYGPGAGTYASRSLVIGGSAAHEAAALVRTLLEAVAAHALECEVGDVRVEAGRAWSARDASRTITLGELATLAQRDREPTASGSLELEHVFTLPSSAFSFAAHVAVVEVDPTTGEIDIKRFVAAHDCGVAVNPLIVDGQIAGGVAQGLGQAMVEVVTYDETGAPSATSFMDYAIFNASDMPVIIAELLSTPTSLTPTGMRGVGEAPSVASPAALANAVADALAPLGVGHIDLPLTPERIWAAIAATARA